MILFRPTVMMVKSKFCDPVWSKTEVSAKSRVLARILYHNPCGLVSAIYELRSQLVF